MTQYRATVHIDRIHQSSGVKYSDSFDSIFDTHTEARKWAREVVHMAKHGGRYTVTREREAGQVVYTPEVVARGQRGQWVKS